MMQLGLFDQLSRSAAGPILTMATPTFYEFFAGGGMARAGLGEGWRCVFANEIDEKKASTYAQNWGNAHLNIGDVRRLIAADLPARADLAWASFPCQDLSLAGDYVGLKGERSGTFWQFWDLMKSLIAEGRGPSVIVLENVCGALTSHGGRDFAAIGEAIARADYRFGAVVVDAVQFVPQSRPRLFIIAVEAKISVSPQLVAARAEAGWHPDNLVRAYMQLGPKAKAAWLWWHLPLPPARAITFADIIEENPLGVEWHTAAETERLLELMSPRHLEKVEKARRAQRRMVGAIYKRTRVDENGMRSQRAEIRFDEVAGCLRTPVGGSSRQSIMIVEGSKVRSRLLSPREAARLMGLPETYELPPKYNEAYHLAGDGVAVPVVRHLAAHIGAPPGRSSERQRGRCVTMSVDQEELTAFFSKHGFRGKGPLCVALVITDHARTKGLPLNAENLLTDGGGQVLGLGKSAVQAILKRHGITRVLASEGGRTSRGSLNNMRTYAAFLNGLASRGDIDLESIERFWIERVHEFFAAKPFKIKLDASKGLRAVVRDVIGQAIERQKTTPGVFYGGAVLQHLVGAKLDCALGKGHLNHNSFSTADAPGSRPGDFVIDRVAIHVTTSPGEAVIEKCNENLNDGLQPILVTMQQGVTVAEGLALNVGLEDRIDISRSSNLWL